jgi:hypothetical protein
MKQAHEDIENMAQKKGLAIERDNYRGVFHIEFYNIAPRTGFPCHEVTAGSKGNVEALARRYLRTLPDAKAVE